MNDEELLRKFEARELSSEQWTHRSHVKVAFLYVTRYPFQQALTKMRAGIKALNAANSVPDGPLEGYNETTTHAFMHLIAAVHAAYGETMPTPTAEEFCDRHPQLLTKHVLRFFYSPERRLHPKAKHTYVEPDLAPLPRINSKSIDV